MHTHDGHFLPLLEALQDESVVLTDLGFRMRGHCSPNVKRCAKRLFHRTAHHLQAHLADLAAAFNVCVALYHELHPDAHPCKLSIKDFNL